MRDYEIKAVITITGWQAIPANSPEEAKQKLESILDEKFSFNAPLSNKSMNVNITIDEDWKNE